MTLDVFNEPRACSGSHDTQLIRIRRINDDRVIGGIIFDEIRIIVAFANPYSTNHSQICVPSSELVSLTHWNGLDMHGAGDGELDVC